MRGRWTVSGADVVIWTALTKSGRISRITPRIALLAPIQKLTAKLVERKFCLMEPFR
jgi:hypothetical protein